MVCLWKLTKPATAGARVLLIKDNKILLVKHTYQHQWYLPGGGIKKGETYEQAVRREMKEELGAHLGKISLFGVYNNFYESKNDSIVVFICNKFDLTGKKDKEIEELHFFDFNRLPQNVSPGTRKRIEEYMNKQHNNFGTW